MNNKGYYQLTSTSDPEIAESRPLYSSPKLTPSVWSAPVAQPEAHSTADMIANRIAMGVLITTGTSALGALCGLINVMIGWLLFSGDSNYQMTKTTSSRIGAIGGVILAVPGLGLYLCTRQVLKALARRNMHGFHNLVLWSTLPSIHLGFGMLGGLVGWEVLNKVTSASIELDAGKVVVMGLVGSLVTFVPAMFMYIPMLF